MTEDEARRMLFSISTGDPEAAHQEADDILLQFIEELGYGELVTTYKAARDVIGFWYA